MTKQILTTQLEPHSQQHLLTFWDQLDESGRAQLSAQIGALDFAQLTRLHGQTSGSDDWTAKAERATPPPAIRLNNFANRYNADDATARGRAALDAGQVGVVLVAGGQGTRLGFDHPKGMFAIGPVSGVTLFQIFFEKIAAISRRHQHPVPLFIMTSPATHAETAAFLDEHNRFGLPAEQVTLFCQGCMPAVDQATGRVLLADRDCLALSPDGHGGMLAALARCGGLAQCHRRGIKQLFYMQVDNPLVSVCDAEFLGYHLLAESELSTQVVAKTAPLEKVGNVVMLDGRMTIIEYSDLPESAASSRNADGTLRLWAGNIAVHVFDVAFLERMSQSADGLPFHIAKKKVPFVNERGERVEPASPNAIKFERFIFDLMPLAENPLVVEVDAKRVFAPVKNAAVTGEQGESRDTPATVQAQLIALHREWLERVGVTVAPGVAVEISPLFAIDDAELLEQVLRGNLDPELHVTQAKYFC